MYLTIFDNHVDVAAVLHMILEGLIKVECGKMVVANEAFYEQCPETMMLLH